MSIAIYSKTRGRSRDDDAERRYIRAAVKRTIGASASAINEGYEVILTITGALVMMVAVLALDAWIWVPRLGH
jgi:hypothetical protein